MSNTSCQDTCVGVTSSIVSTSSNYPDEISYCECCCVDSIIPGHMCIGDSCASIASCSDSTLCPAPIPSNIGGKINSSTYILGGIAMLLIFVTLMLSLKRRTAKYPI